MASADEHRIDPPRSNRRLPFRFTRRPIGAAYERNPRWWRVRGGSLLFLAGAATLASLVLVSTTIQNRHLRDALTTRGVTTNAEVTYITHDRKGRPSAILVGFSTDKGRVSEELFTLSQAPDHIREWEQVQVVYDPKDPSKVVLTSQLNFRRMLLEDIVLTMFCAALSLAFLIGWWIVWRRSRPTTPGRSSQSDVEQAKYDGVP